MLLEKCFSIITFTNKVNYSQLTKRTSECNFLNFNLHAGIITDQMERAH